MRNRLGRSIAVLGAFSGVVAIAAVINYGIHHGPYGFPRGFVGRRRRA